MDLEPRPTGIGSVLAERIVESVLGHLNGLAGFDHWWDLIDDDIQQEIGVNLVRAVDAQLARADD